MLMPMPMPMPMRMLMPMQMQMLMLIQHILITTLLIIGKGAPLTTAGTATTGNACAPGNATTATSWTTIAARANPGATHPTLGTTTTRSAYAPGSAPMATAWTTMAASASPSAAGVCARPTLITMAVLVTASVVATTTLGAARVTDATGHVTIISQLQVGWQEWITEHPTHYNFLLLGPQTVNSL